MDDSPRRIAFIGTGIMGAPMAGHLMDAGYELTVHTRMKSKAAELLDRGAVWADSPAEAADGVDVAISIVGFPDEVERVHLGENGTLAAAHPPRVIVDMSTSRPSLAVKIAEAAKQRKTKGLRGEGGRACNIVGGVDAPVSGGEIGACDATLSIMVGGEDEHVQYVWPLLEAMGRQIVHQGPPGAGQHTKMVNQILIATNVIGVCEGLIYAARAGLDQEKVIESVASGAAGSWSISNFGPRMIRRDFRAGFYVEHFIKDLQIALDESARMGLSMPGLALARQLYEAVRAQGHGRSGTQALLLAMEQLSGVEHPP